MPPLKDRKRSETARKMTSALSEDDIANASKVMAERTDGMGLRAKGGMPLTNEELQDVVNSLRNVTPRDAGVDWDTLRGLLFEVAHLSHKDWQITGRNSDKLASILLCDANGLAGHSRQMFERILHEGNWDGALEHTKSINNVEESRPWAVLVSGVNGIRKTTAMYQPWFSQVLQEALIPPISPETRSGVAATKKMKLGATVEIEDFPLENLPTGNNSFFRQLDHMIATLCNEDFSILYALTGAQLHNGDSGDPPRDLIEKYSNLKASIFSRYRTLSELLGVLLLKEAQAANINAMCETSGRDVAMFHYIDHFFDDRYNKLAVHFTIDDLNHAMLSVDNRMVREMKTGKEALSSGDVLEVIYANAGGPYGSEVLGGVQADSDRVWDEVVMAGGGEGVGGDWYKASLRISAHKEKLWTIRAVRPDGSLGTEHTFGDPRTV